MKWKSFFLLTVMAVGFVSSADTKRQCITDENIFNLAQIGRFNNMDEDMVALCKSANAKRHAAQIAYCNTLE